MRIETPPQIKAREDPDLLSQIAAGAPSGRNPLFRYKGDPPFDRDIRPGASTVLMPHVMFHIDGTRKILIPMFLQNPLRGVLLMKPACSLLTHLLKDPADHQMFVRLLSKWL